LLPDQPDDGVSSRQVVAEGPPRVTRARVRGTERRQALSNPFFQGRSNAMQLGFFAWIREGVRQSVLLGVSDAAEQLGIPGEDEAMTQEFLASLRQAEPIAAATASGAIEDETPRATNRRRRLGRSLKDQDGLPTT